MTGPFQSSVDDRSRQYDQAQEPDHDHAEEGPTMPSGNTYEPGPSFVENDRPDERLTDMPAWLQSFAAQESTRDEAEAEQTDDEALAETADAGIESETTSVSPEPGLPDWLKEGGSEDSAITSDDDSLSVMDFLSGFDDPDHPEAEAFISEDDLPDWLRAFSEESNAPAPPAPEVTRVVSRSVPPKGNAVVRVPPVENIWLSAYERQALGPGGTLFALLASNGSGTVSHAEQADVAGEFRRDASSTGRRDPGQSGLSRNAGTSDDQADIQPEKQANSMRLLLLTLLVVLIIIAISFWQFS